MLPDLLVCVVTALNPSLGGDSQVGGLLHPLQPVCSKRHKQRRDRKGKSTG